MELIPLLILAYAGSLLLGQRNAGLDRAWAQAARRMGLAYQPPSLTTPRRLRGRSGEYVIDVQAVRHGDDQRAALTRYHVFFPRSLGVGIQLAGEGFLSNLVKLLGATDVETGDRTFDAEILIQATDPERALAYLTPARRKALLQLARDFPDMRLDDQGVMVTLPRLVSVADEIISIVARLVSLAETLDGQPDAPEDGPWRGKGRASAGQDRSLGAAAGAPTPPAVAAPAQPRPAPLKPAVDPLSAKAVCAGLFGALRTSEEVQQAFEAYKGNRVRWTGTVRWVDSAPFDTAAGPGPGARAVIDLGQDAPGTPGSRPVQVMVKLSSAEADSLSGLIGTSITFEGQLVSCDGFARTLYINDAHLVP